MTKKILSTIIVIILVGGVVAFVYYTRPPSAPSESIDSAIPASTSATGSTTVTGTVYHISQAGSTVSFQISEVLHGSPFSPVGTTNQVAGDITVSSSSIVFGPIAIDDRTWKTDSRGRDGAIDRLILHAEDPGNEFLTFTPTTVVGVPTSINPGSKLALSVNGNLTISGVTKPETFDVVMNVGTTTLTGTASVALKRSDFNLVIPNIPYVANVTDGFTVTATIEADQAPN